LGETVPAELCEVHEPVDLVDVFRRSEAVPGHLDGIVAMDPRPLAVWLQLGIRHDGTAEAVDAAAIDVLQEHCTLADHRRWQLGRPR